MNIYDIDIHTLQGKSFDFSQYQGKKILVVNTASKCGLTPQYQQLQELHEKFGDKVAVIGVPCNDFAGQEPGSEEEIAQFCDLNYNVSFPLLEKVKIKGDAPHPLYQFLTQKSKNGFQDSEVAWNFQKYILDENGHLIAVVAPQTDVFSDEVLSALEISL